jgi:hypothetical protein
MISRPALVEELARVSQKSRLHEEGNPYVPGTLPEDVDWDRAEAVLSKLEELGVYPPA